MKFPIKKILRIALEIAQITGLIKWGKEKLVNAALKRARKKDIKELLRKKSKHL